MAFRHFYTTLILVLSIIFFPFTSFPLIMMPETSTEHILQTGILNSQPFGILAFDDKFNITFWNKVLELKSRLPYENVLGTSVFSSLNLIDLSKEKLNRVFQGEQVIGLVIVGGNQFRATISPVLGVDNDVIGGTMTLQERSIEKPGLNIESTIGFSEVVENSPLSTLIFNLDGSIFYSNSAYQELWGLSDNDLTLVNQEYNIFKDAQLERNGLLPFVLEAFNGKTMLDVPVFKYQFSLNKVEKEDSKLPISWLKGYMFPILDDGMKVERVVLNFVDLTVQTEARNAMLKSEERLQLALAGGDLGTWDWELDSGMLTYGERWADMLGFTLDEAHKIKWEKLVHPDDFTWVKQSLDDCILGNSECYKAEYRIRTKSGNYKWILDRGKVVEYDETGTVAKRAAGTHLEITERKESETILKESEDKYRRLADNAPIGITVVSEDRFVYANREALNIVRANSLDDFIGLPGTFFITDQNLENTKERQDVVISGKMAPTIETMLKRMNGEEFTAEIVSMPTTYNGKPAIQSLVQDISDKKEAARKLEQNEQQLMQLFDNSPLGIVMLDTNFSVLQVNKGFHNIFGYSIEDIKGKNLNKVLVPNELQGEAETLNRSAQAGRIDYFESYRLDKQGSLIPVVIYALPVVDGDKIVGIYGIYIDIHERVRIEEELKTRNMELDHFVYKVSHDLRAPLASILGLINLTKLEKEPETQEYYVDLMRAQVEKLDQFIHDILSHSKNLNLDVVTSEIDFENIIEACFSDLTYLDAAPSITRSINVEGGVFFSDKWRISEIFRNLISNAIKYSNPESNHKTVEINVVVDKKECRIEIKDNGIGISEEYLPQIFDMFYRGTDRSDGSGIGLYIVKKAIQKLNGTLHIESKAKVGTTFLISIPTSITT